MRAYSTPAAAAATATATGKCEILIKLTIYAVLPVIVSGQEITMHIHEYLF